MTVDLSAGVATGPSTGVVLLRSIENVVGTSGADRITADDAINLFKGGADADTFYFKTLDSARDGTTFNPLKHDTIADFLHGVDLIDLSGIDAVSGGRDNVFTFNTVAWNGIGSEFTAAGQLRYTYATDSQGIDHTIIAGNVDAAGHGNGLQPDFQIDLIGRHVLSSSDFVL